MIDKQFKNHTLKNTLQPVEVKNIKEGDVFYERGSFDWYKLIALEDGYYDGDLELMEKTYKQYRVRCKTEANDILNVLVTEGLPHYCSKYYK